MLLARPAPRPMSMSAWCGFSHLRPHERWFPSRCAQRGARSGPSINEWPWRERDDNFLAQHHFSSVPLRWLVALLSRDPELHVVIDVFELTLVDENSERNSIRKGEPLSEELSRFAMPCLLKLATALWSRCSPCTLTPLPLQRWKWGGKSPVIGLRLSMALLSPFAQQELSQGGPNTRKSQPIWL